MSIDDYCERIDASFWSEPLNAVTNVGFVFAGILAVFQLIKYREYTLYLWLLAVVMAVIGLGSFLFHTFANTWSEHADVFPIYIFQIIFLWSYPRYALQFNAWQISAFFALYVGATLLTQFIPVEMNGSEMYFPTIVTLVLLGVVYKRVSKHYDWIIIAAGGTFAVSLFFRTVDEAICQYVPIGSHFIWHILNAVVLYLSWYSLYKHTYVLKRYS